MLDLKSKSQFLTVKFSFFMMQKYSKNPMKNNKRGKETHPPPPPTPKAWYFNILILEKSDVHLICTGSYSLFNSWEFNFYGF